MGIKVQHLEQTFNNQHRSFRRFDGVILHFGEYPFRRGRWLINTQHDASYRPNRTQQPLPSPIRIKETPPPTPQKKNKGGNTPTKSQYKEREQERKKKKKKKPWRFPSLPPPTTHTSPGKMLPPLLDPLSAHAEKNPQRLISPTPLARSHRYCPETGPYPREDKESKELRGEGVGVHAESFYIDREGFGVCVCVFLRVGFVNWGDRIGVRIGVRKGCKEEVYRFDRSINRSGVLFHVFEI